MSTADLTRAWCEIEVLIDSVAPFLQEVVTGNGSNYQQFSAEIRTRLQKVVLLSRKARQISSDVQRITTSKSQRLAQQHIQHQQHFPPQPQPPQLPQAPRPPPPQMVPPNTASAPNHPYQINSVRVPTPPGVPPNLQYRVVDGKVQPMVGQESGAAVQHGGNWPQRSMVVDGFGQKVGLRAVPVGDPTVGPPTKKQAVVYDLTETSSPSSSPNPNPPSPPPQPVAEQQQEEKQQGGTL